MTAARAEKDIENSILNEPLAKNAYGAVGDIATIVMGKNAGKNVCLSGVSAGLDVFKGLFVSIMLCEHARTAANVKEHASGLIFGVFVTAHSLDMVCYTFAYGFSCYGAYLSDSKPRSSAEKWGRLARSVLLIWGGCVVCDIFFIWSLHGRPPLFEIVGIITGKIVFWDFLRAFPFMLLIMTLFEPVVAIADRSVSMFQRLCAMAILVGVPLALSVTRCSNGVCGGPVGHYLCFLVPCSGGTRFPAIPYMAVFNVGVLTAGLVRRLSEGVDCRDRVAFLGATAVACMPFTFAYMLKLRASTNPGVHDILLKDTYGETLFPLDINRIPPTPAWLMATLGVGLIVFIPCITAGIAMQQLQEGYYAIRMAQAYCEHLGANVLLYLVLSNLLLLASRGWRGQGTRSDDGPRAFEPFERTVIMMATIGFIHYLARSSRK